MNRPSKLLAALALTTLAASANPGTAVLSLVAEADFNKITITFDPPVLPAGEGTTTLSGDVEVLLEIDPATDQVSQMTITNGMVSGTPVSISESTPFVGNYQLQSTTLGAELATPNPPGQVDPSTGEFDASEHSFTVNSGTLSGNISVPLAGINEAINFDFAATPVSGFGSPDVKGTVSLNPTGSTATTKSYEVMVLLPVDVLEVFEAEGPTGPLEIPIAATGNIKLVGPVTIDTTPLSDFERWVTANLLQDAPFDGDQNGDGVPNGLQWALGLQATEAPYPHLLQPDRTAVGTVNFTLDFPPAGTAAPILVLASSDPGTLPFLPLDAAAVSTGNPIPAGTSGPVVITLPKESQGFIRLSVEAP